MDGMKVALAQINADIGRFQHNLAKHLAYIQLAREAEADIVVFPEMALTGYSLQDLALTLAMPSTSKKLDPLRQASQQIDIIASFPELSDHAAYIASAYFSGGEIRHIHRKLYLPINGIFNDRKDFKPGNHITVFPLRDQHIASMLVCRDIWHMDASLRCRELGASILFAPSAVPLRKITANGPGVSAFIDRTVQGYAEKSSQFFVFVNRVGFEEGICFYGGSLVTDPFGTVLVKAPYLEETLVVAEVDWRELERKNRLLPLSYEQQPYASWNREVA